MIAIKVLSCLIKRAKIGGYLLGRWVKGKGGVRVLIFNLLFSNDTLIFCEASQH